jgi:hypothetical protein
MPMKPQPPSRDLVRAYQLIFGAEGARPVLDDLRRLAGGSTVRRDAQGRVDPVAMGIAEGARILFNYIEAMVHMDESTSWRRVDLMRQMKGQTDE